MPEPSGALALAGLKQYVAAHGVGDGALVAIVSGANMNFDRLRFVAERAEVGEQREAVFAVTIPEERGSFRRFCAALGRHAITEFNYRIGDARSAHIFVGVQIASRDERDALIAAFRAQQFDVLDLTDDELAKLHLRHMIGGRSPLAQDERLYRFEFPERPGALTRFLDQHAPGLEHQPVPLPQPRRRPRPHPGRHPGARARAIRCSSGSSIRWATRMCDESEQPGLSPAAARMNGITGRRFTTSQNRSMLPAATARPSKPRALRPS